jgi:glycosyltransferase involved in cell wall biosynthesis
VARPGGPLRICHVTPHLPPDQAANALLPYHLARWAQAAGDEVTFIAHPPRTDGHPDESAESLPGPVCWVPARREKAGLDRLLRLSSVRTAIYMARSARPFIAAADLVHIHSNGLIAEMGALLARREGKPFVLTLYGTEIWHYAPRRPGPDLFTRAFHDAAHVTFYSHGLQTRAVELGLVRRHASVVYPPVAPEFRFHDERAQAEARAALGLRQRNVLINVKRLHPLAGQRDMIAALGEVVRVHPDTRLIICGTGPLLHELEDVARTQGVERHVTFAGLVDNTMVAKYDAAADLFVLPSLLEACPTVALEALATGTPVVTADNPGGVELGDLFGYDVTVVPRGKSDALAVTLIDFLGDKRRTREATRHILEQEFSPAAVERQYREVYEAVLDRHGRQTA